MYNTEITGESNIKSVLRVVEPDGIFRGMRLKGWEIKDDTITFELLQESSGLYRFEKFSGPNPSYNEDRNAILLKRIVEMFTAFVPPKTDAVSGKDVRFGPTMGTLSNFKEWCEFYYNNIDLTTVPLVDIKVLYSSNEVASTSKYQYPMAFLGDSPFITSPYSEHVLSAKKDIENTKYKRYLTFKVIEMEEIEANDPLAGTVTNDATANSPQDDLSF